MNGEDQRSAPTPGSKAGLLVSRAWNSPTANTWAALAIQVAGAFLILPLVLTKFGEGEIIVWFLLLTLSALQLIFRFGFTPTFSRFIAYGMVGRQLSATAADVQETDGEPDWSVIERVCSTMRRVYLRLGGLTVVILGVGGSLALLRPISTIPDASYAWVAWAIVLSNTALQVGCSHFETLLHGANHVAVVSRWQALFGVCALLSMLAVLMFFPNLALLVAVHQFWQAIRILRSKSLCNRLVKTKDRGLFDGPMDHTIFAAVWPPAWRSGVAHIASVGTLQLTGLVTAQIATVAGTASYLLGLRLLTAVEQFSNAPFYSRIPILNQLRGSGNLAELNTQAVRGMRFAYWTFFLAFALLTLFGPAALEAIGSNAEFPTFPTWHILGLSVFLQRYGAMHLQLHSTANRIVWHKVNGIGGLTTVALAAFSVPLLGPDGLVFSLFVGNTVYATLSAHYSHQSLETAPLQFELRTIALPALAIAILTAGDAIFGFGNAIQRFGSIIGIR